MAIIQNRSFYENSYLTFYSSANSFVFEYPFKIYGSNHSYISQCKKLKVIVPKITSDVFLICSSDSLGILFINKPVKIYITLPVYEQILLRLEQLPKYLDYEEENTVEDVYTLESINIDLFKSNCIFINHNQIVEFYNINLKCITSGTFIGWSNWIVKDINQNQKYGIIKSTNYTQRFSNIKESLDCDYIVLFDEFKYQIPTNNSKNINSKEFSEIVIEYSTKKETIIILIEMTNVFIELVMYTLATIKRNNLNSSVVVCSTIYDKLSAIINIQSEWLNSKFSKTIFQGIEPFATDEYPNFTSYNTIYDLNEEPNILFMDEFEFKLLNISNLFENQIIISLKQSNVHDFLLKLEAEALFLEIKEKNLYSTFITKNFDENALLLKNDDYFCFEEKPVRKVVSIAKCNKLEAKHTNDRIEFYINGFIHNKDDEFIIEPLICQIREFFYTKQYMYANGKYYFLSEKKIITILDDKFIVEDI